MVTCCTCLLAILLLHLASWTCIEGLLLKGKGTSATRSAEEPAPVGDSYVFDHFEKDSDVIILKKKTTTTNQHDEEQTYPDSVASDVTSKVKIDNADPVVSTRNHHDDEETYPDSVASDVKAKIDNADPMVSTRNQHGDEETYPDNVASDVKVKIDNADLVASTSTSNQNNDEETYPDSVASDGEFEMDNTDPVIWTRNQSGDKVLVPYPRRYCNHALVGVDDEAVSDALGHKAVVLPKVKAISTQLLALQHQHIFIAALLHNSEDIMPHWIWELVRLLLSLKATGMDTNVFVSVYESGSSDRTKEYLELLKSHLSFLGVPGKIVHGGVTRGHRQRIEFLADVRNRAMEPLQATTKVYDRVLWLSDNLFCADGVVQMLAHALPETMGGLGADAVCGMDYNQLSGGTDPCKFYDTWVAHDDTGFNFRNEHPIVDDGEDKLEASQAFQVFSCWNGMVVFDADIFQKERLSFRTNREDLGECPAAETELIIRDMQTVGRGKIAVSPSAASAYNEDDFTTCALGKQPTHFDESPSIAWSAAPEISECCPLKQNHDNVNFDDCFDENWNRFGGIVPRLNSSISVNLPQAEEDDNRISFLQMGSSVEERVSKSTSFGRGGLASSNIRNSGLGAWHLSGAGALVAFVTSAVLSLRGSSENIKGAKIYVVIFFWMSMSFFMNLLNKQCTVLLHCPFTLVVIQMLVSIVMLARTPLSGMQSKDFWRWGLLALLFGLMLCSSMFAFTHSSVTCLLVLRNCLPLFTLPVERVMFGNAVPASASMVSSLFAIALGAALYAHFAPGHTTTSTGLVWIVINCVATVVHRVLERYLLTSDMTLSFEAMTLINNVIPLVPVGALAWATGETEQWSQHTHLLHAPMAIVVLVCSGIVGLCLGQSSIMVQKCVTATTMMVMQTANKAFIILAAMFFFHDRFTPISFIGCALSLLGCAAYGMAQHSAKDDSLERQGLLPDLKRAGPC